MTKRYTHEELAKLTGDCAAKLTSMSVSQCWIHKASGNRYFVNRVGMDAASGKPMVFYYRLGLDPVIVWSRDYDDFLAKFEPTP